MSISPMIRIAPFANRIRRFARDLRRNTRGLAMIEAAFTIPTLLFTSFAGLEMANMMIVHTKISALALSAADNASRIASGSNLAQPQVREVDVNDVFTGAQIQSGLLDLNTHGRIILSSLETNISGGQWIHWQRCYGTLPIRSAYGAQGVGITGNGFNGMGDDDAEVKATPGNAVMFIEVSYTYQPFLLGSMLNGANIIEYEAAFAVRDARDTSNIFNPSPSAVVRTCPTTGTQRRKRSGRRATPHVWNFGQGWLN